MLPELTLGQAAILAALGLSVGTVGAMVGVGGGFLIVPALLFLYPDATPAQVTNISLVAVFFNAASSSVRYRRLRAQDLRTAGILILLAAPAAVVGKALTLVIDRAPFEVIFGGALVLGAAYLIVRGAVEREPPGPSPAGRPRVIEMTDGTRHEYRVRERLVALVAPVAGLYAGFFGIGGGIVNVPFMIIVLRMPARVAAATSHVELMVAALAALAVAVAAGGGGGTQWAMAGVVSAGTLVGAQIGVRLASAASARLVLTVLGAGLLFAGVRLLL